jgi:hypothetical protein
LAQSVRHPKDGLSSPEHRAEALQVLKQCFKVQLSLTIHQQTRETIDATDVDNPKALDQFLTDHDIVNTIRNKMKTTWMRTSTVSTPFFAKKIWSGTNYPAFAVSLGFGN